MDPYDEIVFNSQARGYIPQQTPSEEEKIYHELIGLYQAILKESGTTFDSSLWEAVNEASDKLVSLGRTEYAKFKITPTQNASFSSPMINIVTLQSKIMRILQRMAIDFEYGDPNYTIYSHMPTMGTKIDNSAVLSPVQTSHQTNNQSQIQHQEQSNSMSVEQRVDLIRKELEEKLTEDQIKDVMPLFEEYKIEPTKWSTASKLMKVVLGLSKDVAVGVISNIIATQLGVPR